MLGRISLAKLAFITTLCVSLCALFSTAEISRAGTWGGATGTVAKSEKKKKSKKRMKVASESPSNRRVASTGSATRYLAQDDLEADLEDELDVEESVSVEETSEAPTGAAGTVAATGVGEDVQILDIQYDSKKAGGTVVISTTGAATYRTREVPSQNQVVVEIANAKLPDRLKRPFNTKDFKQSIVSLNAYQDAGSNTARVVLQFRQPRSVDVRQNGKVLTINSVTEGHSGVSQSAVATKSDSKSEDFDDDAEESAKLGNENLDGETDAPMASAKSSRESADEESGVPAQRSGEGKILPSSTLDQERIGDLRFYGRPISIEVRDTPVRDVITMISDQSGANIIMSDDVQGNITIKLRQVPWDQALSIIMKSRGLGYVRQNGVLRIAPLRQLQAEIEEARRILDAQEATLPLRVKVIPVSFANVTTLATQIRTTLQGGASGGAAGGAGGAGGAAGASNSRGRIEPDVRSSSLIITDTEDKVKRIEQLVKALDTPPLQVMIEGKIVEAKETASRNLGVNWGYQGQDLSFAGGTVSHAAKINPALGDGNTTLDLKLGTLDFLGDLNAKLALFESDSLAKIISSPRVITMNSQRAVISQSVNIPIVSTTQNVGAAPTATTTFQPIPTTLSVLPQITSGGDVLMQIKFDRSFQGGVGGSQAPIETRSIDTNVMVKNGQTTVIGGIYQSDETEGENGTPFLRKVPVLGWLFKSTTKTNIRNELLVFITPRILNADRNLPKSGVIQ